MNGVLVSIDMESVKIFPIPSFVVGSMRSGIFFEYFSFSLWKIAVRDNVVPLVLGEVSTSFCGGRSRVRGVMDGFGAAFSSVLVFSYFLSLLLV